MINQIDFSNYKLFKKPQSLELKPLTILIGKNSSGKSAILKLPVLIENALSGEFSEPLKLNNNGIIYGGEFRDLIYGRRVGGVLEIGLLSHQEKLSIAIGANERNEACIFSWQLNDFDVDVNTEKFKGFIAASKAQELKAFNLHSHYITATREGLSRYFDNPTHQQPDYVGLKGEHVYPILIHDALTTPQTIIKKVSRIFQDNFEGWGVKVNTDIPDRYQLELVKDHLKINFTEVGLGMSHVLPLVVSAIIPTEQPTLYLIEEPELHLHPAAHANLAEIFADSLNENKTYLIETHSQNFVLRLRRLIAEGRLDKDNVLIYYVDFDERLSESNLVKISIDDLGKPRNSLGDIYWPENIFSETLAETTAIRSAQLKK